VDGPAFAQGGGAIHTPCAHKEKQVAHATKEKRTGDPARSGNPSRRAAAREGAAATPGPASRRIVWASNAGWTPTGYGEQTAQVTRRLKRAGHEVAIAANYGLEGSTMEWEGIPVYPRGLDVYSNDVIPAYAMDFGRPTGQQALVITLFDCWVFKGGGWDVLERVASWVPIDHFPAPKPVIEWLARPNVTPIAMSKFGHDAIERAGVQALYVPHAIDTQVFKPTELIEGSDGKIPARQWMGIPDDAFVIGMVSANKGTVDRKSFAESFLAAGMVMQENPDVWLYLHTEPTAAMTGIDLRALLAATGVPEDRVKFPDNYAYRMGIPKEALAAIYTGMDVLLQPSRGEGFGIPCVEAQSTGTPVVVSNATAQPELVGDGWLCEVQPQWDVAQGCWFFTPQVPSIVDNLKAAVARGRGRSQKAIDFARDYDADRVFDVYWRPALEVIL
jgi:glycosyltransferase involved in cell wall biosynthesis